MGRRIFGIHTATIALSPQLAYLPAAPSTFSTIWTWADLRKGAESMNPFDYFKFRYYEKWLGDILPRSLMLREHMRMTCVAFMPLPFAY